MIEKGTVDFLAKKLDKNNERDWFQTNKKRFDSAQDNIIAFTGQLIGEIAKFDSSVATLDPKSCVFRIYRDTRFSKDKRPYKNHLGCWISPGGRKSMVPGYYFHVQPGRSFIAGGKHHPDGPELLKIRNSIAENTSGFLKIVNKKSFVEQFGELWDSRLMSVPKGFDADHPAAEYLKLKEFMVQQEFSDNKTVTSLDFPNHLVKILREMYPLISFLRRSLSPAVSSEFAKQGCKK